MIEFGKINGKIESPEQVSLTRSNSLKRRISKRISSQGYSYFENFGILFVFIVVSVLVGQLYMIERM